jgi:hypothetical protein
VAFHITLFGHKRLRTIGVRCWDKRSAADNNTNVSFVQRQYIYLRQCDPFPFNFHSLRLRPSTIAICNFVFAMDLFESLSLFELPTETQSLPHPNAEDGPPEFVNFEHECRGPIYGMCVVA